MPADVALLRTRLNRLTPTPLAPDDDRSVPLEANVQRVREAAGTLD